MARESALGTEACTDIVWDLTAGQTIKVGTVTVSNDATNLYITYAIDTVNYPDCSFGTLQAWVGNDLTNMPSTPGGTPIPGQFPYKQDTGGATSYTFTIPWADLKIQDVKDVCNLALYVVTHAEVNCKDESETAFGGPVGINIKDPGRWWFYGTYYVCCAGGPPPEVKCTTAFAKGGYVFTTDPKSNPENLPSLGLTKNRWGWAIKLTAPGETLYDIWAGAGLNKTSNGTKVGVLTVNWDGTTATVTYSILAGCAMTEAHLYAGDDAPTTVAPGQYGNLAYFDPPSAFQTFTVALSDTKGGGAWLIAHAVVCCGCDKC
jgi:hypothetical protein